MFSNVCNVIYFQFDDNTEIEVDTSREADHVTGAQPCPKDVNGNERTTQSWLIFCLLSSFIVMSWKK